MITYWHNPGLNNFKLPQKQINLLTNIWIALFPFFFFLDESCKVIARNGRKTQKIYNKHFLSIYFTPAITNLQYRWLHGHTFFHLCTSDASQLFRAPNKAILRYKNIKSEAPTEFEGTTKRIFFYQELGHDTTCPGPSFLTSAGWRYGRVWYRPNYDLTQTPFILTIGFR